VVAKFLCTCGFEVRASGTMPNPDEWHLISDRDFDVEVPVMQLSGRCSAH